MQLIINFFLILLLLGIIWDVKMKTSFYKYGSHHIYCAG